MTFNSFPTVMKALTARSTSSVEWAAESCKFHKHIMVGMVMGMGMETGKGMVMGMGMETGKGMVPARGSWPGPWAQLDRRNQ